MWLLMLESYQITFGIEFTYEFLLYAYIIIKLLGKLVDLNLKKLSISLWCILAIYILACYLVWNLQISLSYWKKCMNNFSF